MAKCFNKSISTHSHEMIREEVSKEQKIVFVSGNFNVLHPGHMRILNYAKSCGDILVVGLTNDESNGVIFKQEERMTALNNMSIVNYVVCLDEAPEKFIHKLKPSIVVKGKEHTGKSNPELEVVESYGGKIIFGSGEFKFSSLDLLQKDFEFTNTSTIQRPEAFLKRRNIDVTKLKSFLEDVKGKNVFVIGDTIVDQYITCHPLGLSQEDPTIVVTPLHTKTFIGGAAIVAAHANSLGANVNFFSVVGNDNNAQFVKKELSKFGVNHFLQVDESRPTTFKQRYRTKEKTLLRVSELQQHAVSEELIDSIFENAKKHLDEADLIIFSDFNYGTIPDRLIKLITQRGLDNKTFMVADCQSSSQVGDISKYKSMNLLTPTEREARLALGDFESGLVELSCSLQEKSEADNIFLKLGSEGVLIHAQNNDPQDQEDTYSTDRIKALNNTPKDPAGAGDCLLVAVSLALITGKDIWSSAYIGSLAAAYQVGRIGNLPLTPNELLLEFEI